MFTNLVELLDQLRSITPQDPKAISTVVDVLRSILGQCAAELVHRGPIIMENSPGVARRVANISDKNITLQVFHGGDPEYDQGMQVDSIDVTEQLTIDGQTIEDFIIGLIGGITPGAGGGVVPAKATTAIGPATDDGVEWRPAIGRGDIHATLTNGNVFLISQFNAKIYNALSWSVSNGEKILVSAFKDGYLLVSPDCAGSPSSSSTPSIS